MTERPSAVLLARLRKHCHDCACSHPRGCWPARGIYCAVGRPMYDAYYNWRRAEVMAGRVRSEAS